MCVADRAVRCARGLLRAASCTLPSFVERREAQRGPGRGMALSWRWGRDGRVLGRMRCGEGVITMYVDCLRSCAVVGSGGFREVGRGV